MTKFEQIEKHYEILEKMLRVHGTPNMSPVFWSESSIDFFRFLKKEVEDLQDDYKCYKENYNKRMAELYNKSVTD